MGFAGPSLDDATDDTTYMPIDRIYPIRDLGMDFTKSVGHFGTALRSEISEGATPKRKPLSA